MKIILLSSALALTLAVTSLSAHAATPNDVVTHYATLVHANYTDALEDAVTLQKAVNAFLANPTEAMLQKAKDAWLVSRDSYGQTEAFRFYDGPIDFVNEAKGEEGPEGRLNSWPLNEAYIDYVAGDANTGIIQDAAVTITKESLAEKNQATDEADVSTGYHAIEFLLWGQDLSLDSAGMRPASDFAETPENERRRSYLKAVTDLLVDDMTFLVNSWKPGQDNYARIFTTQDNDKALSDIISALATLSGFEIASERLATALDSGDQEDEHSCFSDNTHNDFIMNAKGISNVFFGTYGGVKGASIYELIKAKDAKLAEQLKQQLAETDRLVRALPAPIDREVLAADKDSEGRKLAELAVTSLQTQTDLLKEAGKTLGVSVNVASD